ncbi:MAG: TonB-dependent receptor [Myxococcales bacterium]|nr:TonB-dependent receptor [Myxococcales bacterium]
MQPNPLLRPETGTNADVGVRLHFERRRLAIDTDTAFFVAWAEDLIQFQQNARGQARAANVGAARIQGLETAASLRFGPHLRMAAQVTLTRAVDSSDAAARVGKQLPFRPQARAYLRPELRELRLPFALRCGVYADVDFTAGNYRDPANVVRVPKRLLFGAGASLAHDDSGVRLVASAVNLTNTPALDLAGFPLPGRSLFFTLEWTSPPTRLPAASSQGEIN